MWKLHDKIPQVHNPFPKLYVSEFIIFPILNFNFHSVHTMYCINFSTAWGATPVIKAPTLCNEIQKFSKRVKYTHEFPLNFHTIHVCRKLGKNNCFQSCLGFRWEKKYCSASQTWVLCEDVSPQILSMPLLVACAQIFLNPNNDHWTPDLSECASGEQSSFTNHVCYCLYSIFLPLELIPFKESPIIRINIFCNKVVEQSRCQNVFEIS